MVDTNDEWITSRTGIKERRILDIPGKGTSYMGAKAVEILLQKTKTNPEDVDLLICCTVTPDSALPATANIISYETGLVNAFSFDLNAACSGFLFGLDTGARMVESGKYKKVIVVGADKMSSIIDYTDRATCIIFGDGAGAVLLEPTEEKIGLIDSILHVDGSGKEFLRIKNGGSAYPLTENNIQDREQYVYQEGKTVFKFAVTNMAETAAEIMQNNNLTANDIAYLVPHQANKRIIDAAAERMGLSEEKVMLNIHKYGNTTAATLPLCLDEWETRLKKGDNLILAAFGGGFTWGAIYLKWAYNS